jgi:hypothetical protein
MILYEDIYDCPVDMYHKCIETNEFKYLIKEGSYDKKNLPELAKRFELINNQRIDIFGVSPEFEIYFYKQRDVNKLEIKVLQGDRSAITFLNIYKSDLNKIEETLSEGDSRQHHARLHRIIQTHFQGRDSHKLTVFEFYNDINDIILEQKDRGVERTESQLESKYNGKAY